ncbi:hypothetical protein F4804DRAFT_333207 [Jackrogersella minutella]|nr:hypothetical protein F4804DRAFT_333207 [Jackrogersella minutella]
MTKTVVILGAGLPLAHYLVSRTAKLELEGLGADFVAKRARRSHAESEGPRDQRGEDRAEPQRRLQNNQNPHRGPVHPELRRRVQHRLRTIVHARRHLQTTDLRSAIHRNIFIVGDAGDLEPSQAVYAEKRARHLTQQFAAYFASGGAVVAACPVSDKVQFGLTVGPGRGTGQMGCFPLPSLLIWWGVQGALPRH